MSNYSQLKDVLNDIFELNKAELDFGIYRIMNQKRKQVNEFIEKYLPEDIKQALSETQSTDKTEIENELKTLKKNLDNAGIVAEDSPKYNLLKERLQGIQHIDVLEQEVFSHLANFFKRYYKDGDFISMRRYKKDVYAIPYEGEEVKLHWANHDQYYIKSSENFKNYSFKTPDGKTINFQLKEVSTEQNNNKTQGDAERRFAIYKERPVEEIDGVLNINFIYEPFSKATKQEKLLSEVLELLTENIPSTFTSVFTLSPTEKNSKRTLIEKHLNDYVSKNSFDYFIHKDLGGFLSRELDFYIKNEVLYLDDINTKPGDFFLAQLSKVKAIKIVAGKIITFLAQIENFQKKLWLKKKFVIRTDYCITLDKVPSSYYAEIFQNKEQLKAWKDLFDVEINNAEPLVFEPFLVLDTKFFEEAFKDNLLAEFDDLDEQTDGLLINSENFQALNLLLEKFQEKVDIAYIDPPYNTEKDRNTGKFIYKDGFSHSSWLSLMFDRILITKNLLKESGVFIESLDENEYSNQKVLIDFMDYIGTLILQTATDNNPTQINAEHEYILFFGKNKQHLDKWYGKSKGAELIIEKYKDLLSKLKNNPVKIQEELRKWIKVNTEKLDRVAHYDNVDSKGVYHDADIANTKFGGYKYTVLHPVTGKPCKIPEKGFRYPEESLKKLIEAGEIVFGEDETTLIKPKKRIENVKELLRSIIYEDGRASTKNLIEMFGREIFPNPKSETILSYIFNFPFTQKRVLLIDYFAGSGTTGHATIKLNREDGGKRKYILVEMGSYFNTVTKPRIQKVIYSDNWKNGKPQDKAGISQIVKYQVLESYEDTLNNLYLENKTELDFTGKAKEEYLLQYMLELESRDHLFNLDIFRKPFDYHLKVTENNELKPTKVDLVETFNYLIGLYVSKVQRVKDIKVVEGTTRTGIKTLVIWRDLDTTTHDEVEKLLRRFYDSQRTKEFQQIYINGDHHLENLRSEGDSFKIKGIEETFFKKMFNETEL